MNNTPVIDMDGLNQILNGEMETEATAADFAADSLDDPKHIEQLIKDSETLREFIKIKYRINQFTEKLKAMEPAFKEEFKKVFGNSTNVSSELVDITIAKGPTQYKFTEAVTNLEAELKKKKEYEKKHKTAIAIPSKKKVIKLKFKGV